MMENHSFLSFALKSETNENSSQSTTIAIENETLDVKFNALLLFVYLSMADLLFDSDSTYQKRLERFFTWCDKDKSRYLDNKEVTIGVLTMLRLRIENNDESDDERKKFITCDLLPVFDVSEMLTPTNNWSFFTVSVFNTQHTHHACET